MSNTEWSPKTWKNYLLSQIHSIYEANHYKVECPINSLYEPVKSIYVFISNNLSILACVVSCTQYPHSSYSTCSIVIELLYLVSVFTCLSISWCIPSLLKRVCFSSSYSIYNLYKSMIIKSLAQWMANPYCRLGGPTQTNLAIKCNFHCNSLKKNWLIAAI